MLTSGNYQLLQRISTQQNNTILALVLYSTENTFNTNGELLNLQLQINPNCNPGNHTIHFAGADLIPELNSEHALFNATGSVSVNHGISNGTLTISATITDTDGDNLSDLWASITSATWIIAAWKTMITMA